MELNSHERTRVECWTRVMGYHRPTTSFNKGKQSEHRERRFFVEAASRSRIRCRWCDGAPGVVFIEVFG